MRNIFGLAELYGKRHGGFDDIDCSFEFYKNDLIKYTNRIKAEALRGAADAHDTLQECCVTVKHLRRMAGELEK